MDYFIFFDDITYIIKELNLSQEKIKKKKIALYIRISTNEQSIDSQVDTLKDYCERRGYSIYKEYVDRGVSGAKESRPELNKLMEDSFKLKFDTVIVYRFDRFARSTQHLISALNQFNSLGIDFISYSENIDTSSPMGKFAFTIFGALAEFERCIIVERVKAGLDSARKKGVKLGRKRKVVNLDLMNQLRQRGKSLAYIGKKLGVSASKVHWLLKSD